MIKHKVMSQCISSDYCKGWNDAVDEINCGCVGCKYEKDVPSHIKCHGCARIYVDRYETDETSISSHGC